MIIYNTNNGGEGINSVTANFLYMWDGTSWNKLAKDEVEDNAGFESVKIQFRGAIVSTKTVISGPLEFRMIDGGDGNVTYQYRLISVPTGNVTCSVSRATTWGGVGGNPVQGANQVNTFTISNWNTFQTIGNVSASFNGHVSMISVDTLNIPGWTSTSLFYNTIAQKIGNSTSGLKTLIINRY